MALYDVPAPAKINLFLHVTGRRDDGYHRLQTAFRFVDLCDYLNFDLRRDGQIRREGPAPAGLEPEQDLVVRAAKALQRATGTSFGAQINYRKRIPSGGGLGGGSSNAATTLIALNRLWRTGLARDELMRLGLALGADVPVFVFGRAAFAEGVGEDLSPLDLPDRAYVIVQPDDSVSTGAVFASPDLTRNSQCVKMSFFADWQRNSTPNNESVADCADGGQAGYFGRNDLEPVVMANHPRVRQAGMWLARQGLNARMTGSGCCFFAEFATLKSALMWQKRIDVKITSCESSDHSIRNSWACAGLHDHPLRHWIRS